MNIADTAYEKEKLQDRIAKLSGGIAVIRVGAVTETEMVRFVPSPKLACTF